MKVKRLRGVETTMPIPVLYLSLVPFEVVPVLYYPSGSCSEGEEAARCVYLSHGSTCCQYCGEIVAW